MNESVSLSLPWTCIVQLNHLCACKGLCKLQVSSETQKKLRIKDLVCEVAQGIVGPQLDCV